MSRKPAAFSGALAPWQPDRFGHLAGRDQRAVMRLLARVMEASYRRGYQQGADAAGGNSGALGGWRFDGSLDTAYPPPWPASGSKYRTSATARLAMEHGNLWEILPDVPLPELP